MKKINKTKGDENMKKIDMNIKVDDLLSKKEKENTDEDVKKRVEEIKKKSGKVMFKEYCDLAFNSKTSQPDRNGRPTGIKAEEMRKFNKIMAKIDDAAEKTGIVELDDDRFKYLYEMFNEVMWIGGRKIVGRILDRLDEAKIENEKST